MKLVCHSLVQKFGKPPLTKEKNIRAPVCRQARFVVNNSFVAKNPIRSLRFSSWLIYKHFVKLLQFC
jgi:hypothetical protein